MAEDPTPPAIQVPFCQPDYEEPEWANLKAAVEEGRLEGGGRFTRNCESRLEDMTGTARALIVPSCTAALEMMALIMGLQPGDEVIMPDYTFVSTANAIALRGAIPVLVDVQEDTLNIDPAAARAAITDRTRAIMVVHYAGVGCDMDALTALCDAHDLILLEDAAQALGASWNGKALGTFGQFGAVSFHHTKNIACGEGGALLINDPSAIQRAEHVRDKGTDRADFLRGDRVKYEWQALGSSFLLSELAAAVLDGQLSRAAELSQKRMAFWNGYDAAFGALSDLRTPVIPEPAEHNAHIYHLRFPDRDLRNRFVSHMRAEGIVAAPHYVALHRTPGGQAFARSHGEMTQSVQAEDTLARLPLFSAMTSDQHAHVIDTALTWLATEGIH